AVIGELFRDALAVSQRWLLYSLTRLEGFEALVDFLPVDYVPPRGQVFGAAVVVLQVVGVLPDVVAENREQALRDRVVLIRGCDDLHFAALLAGQPDPS